MSASAIKALRITAEGLSYCVAIIACETLMPRKVIDINEPAFKVFPQQKMSLEAEYRDVVKAIEVGTAKKLGELFQQNRKKASLDADSSIEFLNNLLLLPFDDATDMPLKSRAKVESQSPPKTQNQVQEEFRVFASDEEVRSRYLTFPSVRNGDDLITSVLNVHSDSSWSQAMLLAKWLDLEDMLETNFEIKLAEAISPSDAHKDFLGTSTLILLGVGATATLFHQVMQAALKSKSLLALDYNAAALSQHLGLSRISKIVTEEFERRRDEVKKLPWRTRTFWQHLNWDRLTWHPRSWVAVYLFVLPIYLAWSFNCENKQRRLLDEKGPDEARATAALQARSEALKQKLRLVVEDPNRDADDDELLSLLRVLEPPVIWPGATKADPFTPQRLAMAVIEGPIVENLIFRGIVLNRLLSMAGTGPSPGPRALAHVASVLVAQSPDFNSDQNTVFGLSELEILVAGIAQAAAAQAIYVHTGSLLLPIVMGAALSFARLHYEFISRTDFVQQTSWYYRALTTSVSGSMEANVGRAGNYLMHLRHTAWFDVVRMLRPRDIPPLISDADLNTLTSKIMQTFASVNDSPAEKGQSPDVKFASMGALRQATATPPRLGAIDLCNLFVALERSLIFADTSTLDNVNAADFVGLEGSSTAQKRVELEVALSALAPALQKFTGYDAISRHVTRNGKPVSANRSPDKMALVAAMAPYEAMRDEFMLGCIYNAINKKYPHGLDEAGVKEMITYLLRQCVHPNTFLDLAAFDHALFGWYAPISSGSPSSSTLHKEAFLDLINGYFVALHKAYVKEVALYKERFGDDFECALVGRQPTAADRHRVAKEMRVMIDAALRREGVAYLHVFGLTPAAFSRLLRRHSLQHPEVRLLEKQWTEFLEGGFQQRQLASFFERPPMWYDVKR